MNKSKEKADRRYSKKIRIERRTERGGERDNGQINCSKKRCISDEPQTSKGKGKTKKVEQSEEE